MCNQRSLGKIESSKIFKEFELCKNPIYILNKIYLKQGEFNSNIYKSFKNVYTITIYNFGIKTVWTTT